MKNTSLLNMAALVTLTAFISACSSSPKKVEEPPLSAAVNQPAPIVQTDRGPAMVVDDVLFDFEKHNLRPEARSTVEQAAAYLRSNPNRTALVEGHTDSIGDADYNQMLSVARSESIRDALMSLGVNEQRIRIKGLGESDPVADNTTLEGRRANRRVEVIFVEDFAN